jgi:hypothetical protein
VPYELVGGAVTILPIGGLNADAQQETERVDQDMALAAYGIGGITASSLAIAAAGMALGFHMTKHELDGGAPATARTVMSSPSAAMETFVVWN